MAAGPLSPRSQQAQNMAMPVPPPLLHTRSGNEAYDRPHTPVNGAFVSPTQTPTGSPSKKQLPPGATDLPNVFDRALKLTPSSPTKQPPSPNKLALADDSILRQDFNDSFNRGESPPRQSNKENAATAEGRTNHSHAALSRRGQYESVDARRNIQTRGLTAEELQKLQNPKIKRLANVTQLCKLSAEALMLETNQCRLSRSLLRSIDLRPQPPSSR
jgi:cell cycle protein kinase DBF2